MVRGMPTRKLLAALCVAAAASAAVALTSERADAYAFTGCKSLNLSGGSFDSYYRDASLGSYYIGQADTAANKWNAVAVPGELRYGTSERYANIKMYRASYSWGAYAQTVWTCSGGYFQTRTIQINSRTMDPLASWQDRFILIHEFGHAMGLGHTSLGCGVSIMRGDAQTGNSGCSTGNPPWSDDINGMNALY